MEAGESVLLACVAYGPFDVVITWMLNENTVQNSSHFIITEKNVPYQQITFKQSVLQICNLNYSQTGNYFTCLVGPTVNASGQIGM